MLCREYVPSFLSRPLHATERQTPDSDFEGFDGEHRPPSAGGTRSEAEKEVALLEHRLSGQVKGGTMVRASFFLFFFWCGRALFSFFLLRNIIFCWKYILYTEKKISRLFY